MTPLLRSNLILIVHSLFGNQFAKVHVFGMSTGTNTLTSYPVRHFFDGLFLKIMNV
jgi:hypothetical protein